MADNPFEQLAQPQTPAVKPSVAPTVNTTPSDSTNPFSSMVTPTTNSVTATEHPDPSYLDQVQQHVTNTAKALWHGVTGTPESDLENGAPNGAKKQLGFTNENVAYNVGALGKGVGDFLGGMAHDLISSKIPAVLPDDKNISWSDPKANTLLGKYITAPSEGERKAALAEAEAYTKSKGTAAVGHLLNTYIHTAGEYLPVAGPFVTSLIDKAEGGDVGGAVAQVAALAAAHPVAKEAVDTVKRVAGLDPEWEKAKLDAMNSTIKGPTPQPPKAPQPRTLAGERTTLRPTTQTTAGVEAPISALQQENPSAVTKGAAQLLTTPGAADEFQKTKTNPAATKQLTSTIGQVAEDKINQHNAIMEGKPTPDQIAGTQTPSKFQTMDDAAKALVNTAQQTYRKADAASDADVAAWQQTVKQALDDHKQLMDRHNANIDAYNDNLAEGEEKMPHAVYDPNAVRIPEKPQSYSELKAELDRAKAEGNSSDAAIREEAYKTGIPKAEKAVDGWFKQHSDVISPAEYDSAKKLYADSQRFQEISNGLRSATNKGTITGNTLRGLEASVDNKMIRRGQAPGAFQRLLGEDGYDNWKNVTKLFDPIKGAPRGIKAWGTYALEAAAAHLIPFGLTGAVATKFLMDRVMFNPAWGSWFTKLATNLKDMVTREHGELGAPGAVGEPFGEGGAGREFEELMNPQGNSEYKGDERRATSRPTMSATELEDAIKNRKPISNPFDQTEGAMSTINRDPNMPKQTPRVLNSNIDPAIRDTARLNPFPPEEVKFKETPAVKGESGEGAGRSANKPTVRATGPNGSSIELELDGKTVRVKGIINSGIHGDGQRLYDNAIEWAKHNGYDTFEGDHTQTEAGKTAWRRIAERHNARMSDNGIPFIDISGSRPTENVAH